MHKGKILLKITSGYEGSRPISDAMRSDRDFRVRWLHKDFLTRFLGHDKQQTSYDCEQRYDFTSYRSCLGETMVEPLVRYCASIGIYEIFLRIFSIICSTTSFSVLSLWTRGLQSLNIKITTSDCDEWYQWGTISSGTTEQGYLVHNALLVSWTRYILCSLLLTSNLPVPLCFWE